MRIVGLTGGIATGKSTVGRLLQEWGVPVVDADQVAREVVAPGSEGLGAIVEAFGSEVLTVDGALDRPAMRQRILRDPEARRVLEGITHPAIRASIAQRLVALAEAGHEAAVVDAALMVETGSYVLYPQLMVVSCRPETQLARVMARDGMDEADARALVATQLPLAEKERYATVVVRNDGSPEELAVALRAAWDSLLAQG